MWYKLIYAIAITLIKKLKSTEMSSPMNDNL